MKPEYIRLECLKLARQSEIVNFDPDWVILRAKAFEQYVTGGGHAAKAPPTTPEPDLLSKTGHAAPQPRRK